MYLTECREVELFGHLVPVGTLQLAEGRREADDITAVKIRFDSTAASYWSAGEAAWKYNFCG